MNRCESECFNSFETVLTTLTVAFSGVVVGGLIACVLDGGVAIMFAGPEAFIIACVASFLNPIVIAGMIIGGLIGLLVGPLVAYWNCQTRCAFTTSAPGGGAGLDVDTSSPADTCEAAQKRLKAAETQLANIEASCVETTARLTKASRISKVAQSVVDLSIPLTLFGLVWSAPFVIIGLSAYLITRVAASRFRVNEARSQFDSTTCANLIYFALNQRDNAQKRVNELCGASVIIVDNVVREN